MAAFLSEICFGLHAPLSSGQNVRRNWQEQPFRDLKTGGWLWSDSLVRLLEPVNHLLVILALAYVWTVALGFRAVTAQAVQPLIRRAVQSPKRLYSLFREGLDVLTECAEDFSRFFGIGLSPDRHFT